MQDKVITFRRRSDRLKRRRVRMTVGSMVPAVVEGDTADLLVPIIRARMDLPQSVHDDLIAESVREVMTIRSGEARWWAAFHSSVGLYLSLVADDFDREIDQFLSFVPPVR